jgi:hypothetical protein
MSPFLYHYYDYFNALSNLERQLYRSALAEVQAQLVQVTPLHPNSPRMVPANQLGALLEPVNPNHPGGSNGLQRQARTRDTGDGSGQPGGSRQPSPEPHPGFPASCVHPNGSPASQRGSMDSAEQDELDEEYTPSVRSSAKGKKWKSRSPEHSSKVPHTGLGSTLGQVYHEKAAAGLSQAGPSTFSYRDRAPGGSSTPVPAPTSRLVHPNPTALVVRPLGLSLGVSQQPTFALVLGTAIHPLVLDQAVLGQKDSDQEPPPMVPDPDVNFDPYNWLLTASKANRKGGIDAGLMRYQRAAEAYRHECDMRDVCLTSCSKFLSDLARYLGVPPKDLAQEVKILKSQHEEALKLLEEGQRPAKQERLKELEARNQELERALTSMGEVL